MMQRNCSPISMKGMVCFIKKGMMCFIKKGMMCFIKMSTLHGCNGPVVIICIEIGHSYFIYDM